MVVIFIALFIIVCSFNFFMMAYQMNGINRLFYSVPIALIESSIDQYDLSLENAPHFIKETLENKLTSYFEFSLQNYVDNFTLINNNRHIPQNFISGCQNPLRFVTFHSGIIYRGE